MFEWWSQLPCVIWMNRVPWFAFSTCEATRQAFPSAVLPNRALSAAVFLSGLFAWYAVRLAWNSHAFNDVSTSNDATPLWIPQLTMAVGCVILFIAFLDEWWLELRGLREVKQSEEALHNE